MRAHEAGAVERFRRHGPQSLSADAGPRLSDAQLVVARENGFRKWTELKAHADRIRIALQATRWVGGVRIDSRKRPAGASTTSAVLCCGSKVPMISGLVQILLFQGLGELATRFFVPLIPGPVIGLILLLGFLALRKSVNASLDEVAGGYSRHFGLLFVPAAVGVVMFGPHLRTHAVAIAVALVASVVLTIAATALVLKGLSRSTRK